MAGQLIKKTTTSVDEGTGEVIVKQEFINKEKIRTPHYVMYLDDGIDRLMELPGNHNRVFQQLTNLAQYGTNKVNLNPALRMEMAKAIGSLDKDGKPNVQVISNAISALRKQGFIRGGTGGQYMINPNIAWRGDTKARAKAAIDYNLNQENYQE